MKEPRIENVQFRDLKACSKCGGNTLPIWYRVKIDHVGITRQSAERHAGLAMQLGGNTVLADAMGSGMDLSVVSELEGQFCQSCGNEVLLHAIACLGLEDEEEQS